MSGDILDPLCLQIDKHSLTMILQNELASLRWKVWESRGICPRSTLPTGYWEEFIKERCAEWKGYSMREQLINTYVPKDKWEYWQVQKDLKTVNVPLWYRMLLEEENV